jgi:MobA/MobL family
MSNLATWFTPSLKVMSRTNGDSAVAASAYRACINLTDERTGEQHEYKNKWGHVSTELIGFTDMRKLWNDAEKSETRKNSSVAREIMVPMPSDWTDEQRKLCARGFGEMLRARYGVAVQVSIHRQANGKNDHAHILFTTREVDANGVFGKKTRILDEGLKNGEVSNLREAVCDIMNQHAKANGSDWFAYAGKFVDIDPDHIPTKHIAHNCPAERRAELEAENAAIIEARSQLKRLSDESEQVTRLVNSTIEKAKNAQPVSVEQAPKPVAHITLISVSPVEAAYVLKDAAFEYYEAKRLHHKNTDSRKKWVARLALITAETPSIWERVQLVGSKLTKRITPTAFIEREERKTKATKAIAKCDTANEKLKAIIDNPAKQAQYVEYNRNPDYRNLIEAANAESPDARRKTPHTIAEQAPAYKPSSIELETALAPP